ncbi:MAG: hypothetical protein LBH43_19620 [Treponema sp.]|nr:hypothetical protein [Treponema sp.]
MIFILSIKKQKREMQNARYLTALRIMGLVYCAVALYRSIFVSSYPNRLVWFDSMLNSPFLIRCFALFAELSFIGAIALNLLKLNAENPLPDKLTKNKFSNVVFIKTPYVSFGCIAGANIFAFCGLITQLHIFFAIEETLWMLAFALIIPLIFAQLKNLPKDPANKLYRILLTILAVWCVGYTSYQVFFALPFVEYARTDTVTEASNLHEAIFNFTATQDFESWGGVGFAIWHSGYFTLCVWMMLFFMNGARKNQQLANRD